MRRGRVAVFGQARYAPGGAFGPRRQSDYQLVAVMRGEVQIRIDGRDTRVNAGQITLLHPGTQEEFRFTRERETLHTWCSLATGAISSSDQATLPPPGGVQPLSDRVSNLIEIGLGIPQDIGPPANAFLDDLGLTVIRAYLMEYVLMRGRHTEPEALQRARAFMEAQIGRSLTVIEIADAALVSTPHLIRLWRQQYGSTPARDLWRIRTQRGVDMLRETGLPVAVIADRMGFRTPFHFSRLVREATGMSPRTLREEAWHGASLGNPLAADVDGPVDEVE